MSASARLTESQLQSTTSAEKGGGEHRSSGDEGMCAHDYFVCVHVSTTLHTKAAKCYQWVESLDFKL